jgi:hypothetical protein
LFHASVPFSYPDIPRDTDTTRRFTIVEAYNRQFTSSKPVQPTNSTQFFFQILGFHSGVAKDSWAVNDTLEYSETLATTHQTTRRYILEDRIIYQQKLLN